MQANLLYQLEWIETKSLSLNGVGFNNSVSNGIMYVNDK